MTRWCAKGAERNRSGRLPSGAGGGGELDRGLGWQWLGGLALSWDTAWLSFDVHMLFARSVGRVDTVHTTTSGLGLAIAVRKVYEVGALSLGGGFRPGLLWVRQQPRRGAAGDQLAPMLDTLLRADLQLPAGMFLGIEAAIRTLRLTGSGSEPEIPVHGLFSAGVGKHR